MLVQKFQQLSFNPFLFIRPTIVKIITNELVPLQMLIGSFPHVKFKKAVAERTVFMLAFNAQSYVRMALFNMDKSMYFVAFIETLADT